MKDFLHARRDFGQHGRDGGGEVGGVGGGTHLIEHHAETFAFTPQTLYVFHEIVAES